MPPATIPSGNTTVILDTASGEFELEEGSTIDVPDLDSDGIRVEAASISLTINGTIIAEENGVLFDNTSDNGSITIGATGVINAEDDAAIDIESTGVSVLNMGALTNSFAGISAEEGGNATIENQGTIQVEFVGIVNGNDELGSATVDNSGTIQALGYGIASLGSQSSVVNSGSITAAIGVYLEDGATLNNTGDITSVPLAITFFDVMGAVVGGEADERVINSGTIDGLVFLDDGDDLYRAEGDGVTDAEVNGGSGADRLIGGTQGDMLVGGEDADLIRGRDGDDNLEGGEGNDSVMGGNGSDTMEGDAGNDMMSGGAGADRMRGGEGNDSLIGGSEADRMTGGVGDDLLRGGTGNDFMAGQDGNDMMYGGLGDDLMRGGGNDDMLSGGRGDDKLVGGLGADTLDGGFGNDVLIGGDGSDTFVYGPGGGDDTIRGLEDDVDVIDLSGFEFADVDEAMSFATQTNFGVLFEFEGGGTLFVQNFTVGFIADELMVGGLG